MAKKMRKYADGGDTSIEYEGTDEDAMATAKARMAQRDAEYAAQRALDDEEALGRKNIAALTTKKPKSKSTAPKTDVVKVTPIDESKDSPYVKRMIARDKAKAAPRSFKPLNMTERGYATGGKVRGAGCATKGVKKARMF